MKTKGIQMKIIADTHCHTIASTHAYNTVMEMAAYAKKIGLSAIAITDHGPEMPDSPHVWHFANMSTWPEEIEGIRVFTGCEVNILDREGSIDMDDLYLAPLDWVIASFHGPAYHGLPNDEDTLNAMLAVAKNPLIDVFGHAGTPSFRFDYEMLIRDCIAYDKLIELNGNSYNVRKGSSENCLEIAKLCKNHEIPVIVNSDAHICYKIASVDGPLRMLDEIDFPHELIINADRDRFFKYMDRRKKIKQKWLDERN